MYSSTKGVNPPMPAFQDVPGFANHLLDVDLGYAEEAALFAEMKALKARVVAHCASSEKKRFKTQTTSFLRDIVQHLPENPMQVPGARSVMHANLVRRGPGTAPAQTPSIPARVLHQGQPAYQMPAYALPRPLATPIASTTTTKYRVAMDSPFPVPYLVSIPRGQKRALEDTSYDSPSPRKPPSRSSPHYSAASYNNVNTPELSPEVHYTSTPHGHHSFPSPTFSPGPPETPSPSGNSARKNTGVAYLSGNFCARRSLPHRQPARPSVLPFGPLGLEEDEIPRFLGGL